MQPTKFLPYTSEYGLSDDEAKLLEKYVTDTGADIFALHGLTGIIGASFARYSRQKGGVKQSLLELVKDGEIDPVKSKELMERILIQYGDDSVGELEGAHLAMENVSMLATKEIEDRRIGGSPIEQSSRYLYYDHQDVHGNYRYYRGKDLMESPIAEEYIATMDSIFDTYCTLIEPVKKYLESVKPMSVAEYDILGTGERQRYDQMPDEKTKAGFERTYNIDLKTKTCDTLRGLLPVSTLTNLGLFGNGRFYQNLLTYLYSQDIPELHTIAEKSHTALDHDIPVYVKRAKRNEHFVQTRKTLQSLSTSIAPQGRGTEGEGSEVRALDSSVKLFSQQDVSANFIVNLCAEIFFPYSHVSTAELRDMLQKASESDPNFCQKIIDTLGTERKNRRDHLPRAFEYGYPFQFEIEADYGMYRDLQRHRMMTQQRQTLTPYLGMHLPVEIIQAGVEKEFTEAHQKSAALYEKMLEHHDDAIAQYALCMGFNIRFTFGMNLRELSHFIELRTGPQGHPNYRRVAQKMLALLPSEFANLFKFADTNDYFWARGDSEAKQRVKERKLEQSR